jgi:hypothetical protein
VLHGGYGDISPHVDQERGATRSQDPPHFRQRSTRLGEILERGTAYNEIDASISEG